MTAAAPAPAVVEHRCGGCDYATSWALDLWEHLTRTGHRKAERCQP